MVIFKFKKSIENKISLLFILSVLCLTASCGLDKKLQVVEKKAKLINHYEMVALKLARENRELKAKIKNLEFNIQKLKQENNFRQLGSHVNMENKVNDGHHGESNHGGRTIASVNTKLETDKDKFQDLVQFKTYKWTETDMLKMADKEFKAKNFEAAAQFYNGLIEFYPHTKFFNDEFYYKAGISAYESGKHHDWTLKHFETLMNKYPTSEFYRAAKLWRALTYMKRGEKNKFFDTVEEFRKKYRNTEEWKILSHYYEKIEEKIHE